MKTEQFTHKNWIDLVFLALGMGVLYTLFLGHYPLFVPDGARYSEIAREIVKHGHYIIPHLNGLIYIEKPPLFYWILSLSIHIFGLSEISVRLVNVSFGILGCLLTYLAAWHFFDRRTALLSALVLALNPLYFFMAHFVTLDMSLTFFLSLALFSFLLATQAKTSLSARNFMWLFALSCALAVLTKGLVGFVFPVMIIGLWVLFLNKWRDLKALHLPSTLIIFLIVALPWHILAQHKHSGFFYFYFWTQQFGRYATLSANRYEPIYFFLLVLIAGFFPWSAFLVQTLKSAWPRHNKPYERDINAFLLIWAIAVFIFFSFSKSKLIPYILPIFPALAVMMGHYLRHNLAVPYKAVIRATRQLQNIQKLLQTGFKDAKPSRAYKKRASQLNHNKRYLLRSTYSIRIGFLVFFCFALVLGIYFFILPRYYEIQNPHIAHVYFFLLEMIVVLWALATNILFWFNRPKFTLIALFGGSALFLITLLCAFPNIDHRTKKPLALALKAVLMPQDKVVMYSHYYQDIPFYIDRTVDVVDWENELSYGLAVTKKHPNPARIITTRELKTALKGKTRLFVVTDKSDYDSMKTWHVPLFQIDSFRETVLLSNKKD